MANPVPRFILVVVVITLGGCEAIGLRLGKPSPATETSAAATTSTEPVAVLDESTPTEIEPAPADAAAAPTPAAPPKSPVAVLDSNDLDNARALHKQALLQSNDNSLSEADLGYYMDVQKAQLIQLLRNTEVDIDMQGNFVILKLPGNDSFGSNSAELEPGIQDSLAMIAKVLEEFRATQITIHGHTDDAGAAAYNQKLSERRALAVAGFLLDAGIANQRIAVVGIGETQPVGSNATADGRARNRRIEIYLDPITQ